MRYRSSSTRVHDHSIVGWISTTDAMLLGMALMFTLASYIQTKYTRAEKERIEQVDEIQGLKSDLETEKQEQIARAEEIL